MACSRRAMKRVDIAFDTKSRVVVDQKEFKVGDVTKERLTKLVGSPRYCFCDSSRTTLLQHHAFRPREGIRVSLTRRAASQSIGEGQRMPFE